MIYLDYAATTPMSENALDVLSKQVKIFTEMRVAFTISVQLPQTC